MDFDSPSVVIAWLIAAPAILFGLLLLASFLEHNVVAPTERARRIRLALSHPDPDAVEREVAALLRSIDRPHRVAR